MLIDWFTVAAQILNFLVIVYLLKRFLYGRIIRAMDEREQKIASRLGEADDKIQEAEDEIELYREKNAQFEAQREEMFARAREEVEAKRRELMHEAREEVQGFRERWLQSVQEERESFMRALRESMCEEAYRVSRRALAVLANAEIEKSMIGVFTEKIRGLDTEKWKSPGPSDGEDQKVTVRTAFEVSKSLRKRITDAVQDQFPAERTVEFETSPELICGIEMRAQDQKLAWSIADYMEDLEERVARMIEVEAHGGSTERSGKIAEGASANE